MAVTLATRLAQFAASILGNGGDAASARAGLVVPFELIEQKSPTAGQTEIDFTNLPSGFNRFWLEVDGLGVETDDTSVLMRVQTGGSTWQTTGYGYIGRQGALDISASSESYSVAIPLHSVTVPNRVGNAAGEGIDARIDFNAKDTSNVRRFRVSSALTRADGLTVNANLAGFYGSTAVITGVRIYSSAFKAQGNVKLFGIRA